MKVSVTLHSHQQLALSVCSILANLLVGNVALNCDSLTITMLSIFSYASFHLISSLVLGLFRFFSHFSFVLFVFGWLSSEFFVLWVQVLNVFFKNFSYSMTCLLILLTCISHTEGLILISTTFHSFFFLDSALVLYLKVHCKTHGHLQMTKHKNYNRLLTRNHASKKKVEWNIGSIEKLLT